MTDPVFRLFHDTDYSMIKLFNDITIGVPQGSCLGPLLFLIYINDLPLAITNSNTSMYADDTSICYHSHEITRLNEAINNDLYKLEKWLEGNKLSLNL